MASYWCHICYRTVPASEATTHVHDRNAPGRSRGSGGNSFGPDRVKRGWRAVLLAGAQVTFWKLI